MYESLENPIIIKEKGIDPKMNLEEDLKKKDMEYVISLGLKNSKN